MAMTVADLTRLKALGYQTDFQLKEALGARTRRKPRAEAPAQVALIKLDKAPKGRKGYHGQW